MHDHPKSNYAFLDMTSIPIARLEEQASLGDGTSVEKVDGRIRRCGSGLC